MSSVRKYILVHLHISLLFFKGYFKMTYLSIHYRPCGASLEGGNNSAEHLAQENTSIHLDW